MKKPGKSIGSWAFLIAVVVAVIAAVFSFQLVAYAAAVYAIIVVLGLLIGLLNITSAETKSFLFAAVALVIVGYAASAQISQMTDVLPFVGLTLQRFLDYLMLLLVPAVVIVALKTIFEVAKD